MIEVKPFSFSGTTDSRYGLTDEQKAEVGLHVRLYAKAKSDFKATNKLMKKANNKIKKGRR